MTQDQTRRFASIAYSMGLNLTQTVVLPAVVERALGEEIGFAGNLEKQLAELENNKPVRDYLAGVCRKVAASVGPTITAVCAEAC